MERLTKRLKNGRTILPGGLVQVFSPEFGCFYEGIPVNKLAEYEDTEEQGVYGKWIPVSERLPEEPEENEIFGGKPLELYLVSIKGGSYSFRAFWNGNFFTNGWQKLDVIAWMPLPEPYRESEVQE